MKIYVILATAGIAFLYILAYSYSPPFVSVKNIWKYEGKEIVTEGKVINKFGNMMEIRDGDYSCYVYSWNDASYGDVIRVKGMVEEKNGMLVIYAREIKIKEKWNNKTISLPYLARNILDYVGCNVRIEGYVYSAYQDYFYLMDENGEYRIAVYCENSSSLTEYEKVVVDGMVRYNEHKMKYYIEGFDVE